MRRFLLVLALSCFSLACRAGSWSYGPSDTLYGDASRRVVAEDYEGLLKDAERFQTRQERLPDGRWKLSVLFGGLRSGFAQAAQDERDWARQESALIALATRHPTSSNAWLMLATMYDSQAWAVRGPGFSDTVSHEQYRRFRALLKQARAVLDGHRGSPEANPQWYALRVDIAGAGGEGNGKLDAIFEDALRVSPNYHETWFNRLNYLAPKWGGSVDQMLDLIAKSTRHASATDGTGLMARLMWVGQDCGCIDLLAQPGIDRAALRKSYDDVLDRFPVDFNAQHFVLQACAMGDKAETAHLLQRVSAAAPDIGEWQPTYERCRAWAVTKDRAPLSRNPALGQRT